MTAAISRHCPPSRKGRQSRYGWILGAVLLGGHAFAQTEEAFPSSAALKQLSIEELMDVEVTSVSRTAERLEGAAAAIAVVSNEDIRRSGVTALPEALRLVPGIHVARETSSTWAVSARGFSSVNSEKLLVLSDTRSIYTPLYSGVFWDVQDHVLEDIDRIEVIRGPGASLWGSNAVNGVINITTKSARDTQGIYAAALGGTEERAGAVARYGGRTENGIYYRVFGQFSDRDSTYHPGASSSDDWRMGHFGFRADWDVSESDTVTVQSDGYRGTIGQLTPSVTVIGRPGPSGPLEVGVSGGNILARWRHRIDEKADWQFRIYYDRTHRNDPSYLDDLDTFDLDFQHRFSPWSRHELLWGLNYRFTSNRNVGKGIVALDPFSSHDDLISGFVQDQITFFDTLRFTLGTKLEHNDFSGFEVQPTARLAWDLLPGHTLWTSVSRAVRVPTRIERDVAIDATDPAGNPVARLSGNKDFAAEELLAYELGYRWKALDNLFIDLAAFHNRYRGLASLEFGQPFIDPQSGKTIVPVENQNLTDGRSQGIETLVTFSPIRNWKLSASYSFIDMSLDPSGQDLNRGKLREGSTPRHQFGLRSFVDLPGDFQFDAQFRTVSAITSLPESVAGEGVPGYSELDVRLAWRPYKPLEISVVGQNLLHDHHPEFGVPAERGEIQRGVYGKVAWRF